MSESNTIARETSYGSLWVKLFIGIMGLQAALELVVGGTILFAFPTALKSGFGITYSSDLDALGIALGLYLLFLTALIILCIIWAVQRNRAASTLGVVIGLFLLTFGVVTTIRFGDPQPLMVDGIRGALTIVFAFLARKQF